MTSLLCSNMGHLQGGAPEIKECMVRPRALMASRIRTLTHNTQESGVPGLQGLQEASWHRKAAIKELQRILILRATTRVQAKHNIPQQAKALLVPD